MEKYRLPFGTGRLWLVRAWEIFTKAPLCVAGLLALYALCLSLPNAIVGFPYISALLAALATPFAALAFAACGKQLRAGERPTIVSCLKEGFKTPETRNKLLLLGFIYGVCVILISLLISLLAASSVANWKQVDGHIDPTSVIDNIPWLAFIIGSILYSALLGVTAFSPMLIAWRGQPIAKAFFFSLVVCWRNLAPIICLGLLLFLITVGLAIPLSIFGALGDLLAVAEMFVISCLAYCTLYPMWHSIFEE